MKDPAARLLGYRIIVDYDHLPREPDHRDDARRIVRHGMKDVLAWLGQQVGPKPGEALHAYMAPGHLFVSQAFYDHLAGAYPAGPDGYIVSDLAPTAPIGETTRALMRMARMGGRRNAELYFDTEEVS